jgi:RNA polymerase sigma-70 factor (ECF subfamily)
MPSSDLSAAAIINACLESGSHNDWTQFVRCFQPLIASVVIRVMRRYGESNPSVADDLIQECYLRLCKDECRALRQFEHRHEEAIFGYVKVVAASVAMDHFRARKAEKRSGEVAMLSDDLVSTVPSQQPDADAAILMKQISFRLERITENQRDRAIFWLYYQQGYTANDISKIPGISLSAKGVESCILRLTQALRREMNFQKVKSDAKDEGLLSSPPLGEVR